jgi:hypothetical protein
MDQALSPASFRLTLGKESFLAFTPLLQRGIRVAARVGGSLRGLLEDQFGLNPEYLKERIKTVFLDGKPVDDWDAALVHDGSVLALSGAMPGLAGATLRRGGFFAGLRSQITHRERQSPLPPEEGRVTVKLFNLLIPEAGPLFLERGIFLSPEEFEELRKSLGDESGKEAAEKDSIRRETGEARRIGPAGPGEPEWVFLSVRFRG